jgi:hypothetical protein
MSESVDRQQEAYELKSKGYSYQHIGYLMKIPPSEAWQLVNSHTIEHQRLITTSIETEKVLHLNQLDYLTVLMIEGIKHSEDVFCPVTGKLLTGRDKLVNEYASNLLKVLTARAKLLGLDKVSAPEIKEVVTKDLKHMTTDELKTTFGDLFRK